MTTMFTVEDRNRVRDRVLALASADARVVAGAVVGSLALGEGDRWSDLDLTFAVAEGTPLLDVLDGWTRTLSSEFGAVHLFDLPSGASLYRVFLIPGCLQFDLSFTPASAFGATSPKFRLLFGEAVEKPYLPSPELREHFGYAVHHALRARFCIERGRVWQAEYWISGVRDYALDLACLRHNLPTREGRGYDDLPAATRAAFQSALARSLERDELLRALAAAITGLLHEAAQMPDIAEMAASVEPQLNMLTAEPLS
jgi:predicted nucleotidyltransferase